jgi:tellurite resistance protein TerC
VILGFIGAKLVIHALHTNELSFINGGEHVTVIPEIPTWLSLTVILMTLVITTVASLAKNRRVRAERAAVAARGPAAGGVEGSHRAAPAAGHRVAQDGAPGSD